MWATRDIATALYYPGIDPFTNQEVYVAKGLRDRKMQRAPMRFFRPENWFTVRRRYRGRAAGSYRLGLRCLIPAQPPKEAIEARRRRVDDSDHYHNVANPAKGEKPGEWGLPKKGYRPGGRTAHRSDKSANGKAVG